MTYSKILIIPETKVSIDFFGFYKFGIGQLLMKKAMSNMEMIGSISLFAIIQTIHSNIDQEIFQLPYFVCSSEEMNSRKIKINDNVVEMKINTFL